MSQKLTLFWQDNNGRVAENLLHPAGFSDAAGVQHFLNEATPPMQALSDAALFRAEWSVFFPLNFPVPTDGVPDTTRKLLLFYGNATASATIIVPSPRPLPVDMVGAYRGVRLVMDAPEVSPLLAALGSSLAGAHAPGGAAWPMPLLAGGFTRYGGT